MRQNLYITDARDGFVARPKAKPMPWAHTHDELELNLVLQGKAVYLLNDRRYDLSRQMLVWLFPGQEHLFFECSPDYQAWILVFKPNLLQHACRTSASETLLQNDPAGQFCKRITLEATQTLDDLLARVAASEDDDVFNAGLGYALMSAWDAYRTSDEIPTGAMLHPSVEQTLRLLQEEIEPETIETLARRVGLSASHLSRLFSQQTGMSLTDFRNQQRLQRLLRLMRSGTRFNLAQAALEAGFGSYAQFFSVFKARMGCSPAQYFRTSMP